MVQPECYSKTTYEVEVQRSDGEGESNFRQFQLSIWGDSTVPRKLVPRQDFIYFHLELRSVAHDTRNYNSS